MIHSTTNNIQDTNNADVCSILAMHSSHRETVDLTKEVYNVNGPHREVQQMKLVSCTSQIRAFLLTLQL